MRRTYLICGIIFSSLVSHGQKTLTEDYYFIVMDGEVTKLAQSNDTLYQYHCYIDKPCVLKPEEHYKILGVAINAGKYLFRLEQLDTISLTAEPYPENRYSVLVLKRLDSNRIAYIEQQFRLSKKAVTTDFIDSFHVEDRFGFTYFSKTYYASLSKWKPISTKTQVEDIIGLFKTDKYKKLIEQYESSHLPDMYGSGLTAELVNNACIDKGFNPIGAARIINDLMRK